ncbi:MAG: TetR/AcrR family transcriptional regulator C-terminal domain-containing protein [Chloroflexota bacterium]|nr:TetR/AcrR family transcriptional regulator C-terminal domain-containing protein [Chloroflexota bacterium]
MAKVSKNSTDPRALRTRHMLRDALFALLQTQPFDAITVRAISGRAGLNNATFYLHFQDKWAMLESVVEEIQRALDDAAPFFPANEAEAAHYVPTLDIRLFEHIQTYWEFYQLMLGRHGVPSVGVALRQQLERIVEVVIAEVMPGAWALPMPRPLVVRFLAAAYVGVIEWWLESEPPAPPRTIAEWVWSIQLTNVMDERFAVGSSAPNVE